MHSMETANATAQPVRRIPTSEPEKPPPSARNLTTLTRLAPAMVGTARKNVNSAATVREQPMSIAPRIVAPERLVPGTSARNWNRPMNRAMR